MDTVTTTNRLQQCNSPHNNNNNMLCCNQLCNHTGLHMQSPTTQTFDIQHSMISPSAPRSSLLRGHTRLQGEQPRSVCGRVVAPCVQHDRR